MLIVGVLGIYAIIRTHAIAGWRWGQMIIYGLYVLLAVMVFYNNITGSVSRALPVLGWLLVIAGIALIGYGIWMYQKLSAAKAAAIATSATPSASSELPSTPVTSASTADQSSTAATPAPTTPPIQPAPGKSSSMTVDGSGDGGKTVKPGT
jgi:hypothetical protein